MGNTGASSSRKILPSTSQAGHSYYDKYTNPGKIFGNYVYFGSSITDYNTCRPSTAAGSTMVLESTNTAL